LKSSFEISASTYHVPLSFVTILCMKKSVEKNQSIIKMDIAQIKDRVEDQIHVQINKPYMQGKLMLFEKSDIFAFLQSETHIGLAHP